MKKQLLRFSSVLMMASALFLTACEKEGPAGPQGEQGEQGAKGDKGDKGDPGEAGETGTANVIYSAWTDVTYGTDADSATWIGIINAPSLTDSILTTGEIKVYMNFGTAADPDITPLPFFNGSVIINTEYVPQQIALISNVNASTGMDDGEKIFQYRYILIPGGTKANRSAVDWNDYNAVKAYYGLKD